MDKKGFDPFAFPLRRERDTKFTTYPIGSFKQKMYEKLIRIDKLYYNCYKEA